MGEPMTSSTALIMSQALAPVFMLTAIGALITGMSTRYGRIIDRTRTLLRDGERLYGKYTTQNHVRDEVYTLFRRAKHLRNALILAVSSIVFVVLSVVAVFLDLKYHALTAQLAEISFLMSLFILLASTVLFIHDFVISLNTLKLDIHTRGDESFLIDEP